MRYAACWLLDFLGVCLLLMLKHRCRPRSMLAAPQGLRPSRKGRPPVEDLTFDMDGLAISKADTKVEDTPIKMVVMGDAYLERKKTEEVLPLRLPPVEKVGKVVLTFFTGQYYSCLRRSVLRAPDGVCSGTVRPGIGEYRHGAAVMAREREP